MAWRPQSRAAGMSVADSPSPEESLDGPAANFLNFFCSSGWIEESRALGIAGPLAEFFPAIGVRSKKMGPIRGRPATNFSSSRKPSERKRWYAFLGCSAPAAEDTPHSVKLGEVDPRIFPFQLAKLFLEFFS
jgi:hypothetical protein